MAFPDERDRNTIRRAEQVENLATDLCDWLSEYNPARRRTELLPVNEGDEFEVLQLRRLAGSLYTSSKVPVAAAAYGASQVGKSLFMGQVLRPQSENYCPIGGDETLGEPAYYKNLSFDNDLNPQCGSQEATALVTRFTTKDRIGAGVSPQYPVMVRALTRAEWLRVLARGFHAECKTPATTWQQTELETLFEDLARKFPDQQVDRKWRMDILDAFSYMRAVDRRGFQATEAVINGLLSRYPLSEDGYVAVAGALFWDNWPTLTALFVKIASFLKRITLGNHDPAIFCHWAGVRFLLDSQRSKVYERPNSKIWNHVAWSDIYLTPKEKYFVLEYRPNSGMGNEELETIQAGMLELVMPVLPHRLSEEWRKVIEQMDFLDVPGMRAVRTGIEQGKRTSADSLEEQMEIVKRGKVSYLFERFVDELQIQTLFLLLRGGNLEVKAQMKYHVEKWGRARYGEKVWPLRVQDEIPALFIGMSGLDEEFRNREIFAEKILYDTRLNSILDTLGNVLTDFGGKGKAFTNVYPIRYPGTWDTNEEQRLADNPEKWDRARKAFLESELVKTYVRDPAVRWDTAMRDGDGGQSLISMGIRAVTSADAKQDQLTKEIGEVQNRLLQLSRDWVVDPDTNIDRERRVLAAKKVVDWLTADEERIYHRVHALEESLCMAEGEELQIADCADNVNRRHGDPLPKELKNYLHEWATVAVPKRWENFCNNHRDGEPWLDPNDMNIFTRFLRDYLLTDKVFDRLVAQVQPVVGLKTRDEAARRRARRKYVRIILNDYVMNPGPSRAPLESEEEAAKNKGNGEEDYARFGLMASFVKQWANRLPLALALGAGEHIKLPAGNMELIHILEPFDRK
ncbi:MAG: virulence factor SrfC family protein [Thermoguttaceae bacterium]